MSVAPDETAMHETTGEISPLARKNNRLRNPFDALCEAMADGTELPEPQTDPDTMDTAAALREEFGIEEELSLAPTEELLQALDAATNTEADDNFTDGDTGDTGDDSPLDAMPDTPPAFIMPLTAQECHTLRLRVVEALLFAATSPLDINTIEKHLNRGPIGEGADIPALLAELKQGYAARGIELVESAKRFSLRTAPDLADYLRHETVKPVKLSRVVSETLAIIAYHQPVTRAEVESIRGVATSRGTLDYLMQLGWVRPGRRRETPGRPLTWVTTPAFLDHFGLGSLKDLPGMDELKAAGLLDTPDGTVYGVLSPDSAEDLPPSPDGEPDELPDFIPAEDSFEDNTANAKEKEPV